MRQLFLWTIFVLIFSGCHTSKEWCQEHYPAKSSIKDSINVKDSVAITYVPFYVPKDSIIWHDSIPCDVSFSFIQSKGNLTQSVKAVHGKITFKCQEDSLRAIIKTLEHFKTTHQSKEEVKVPEPVTKWVEHWYDPFCHYFTLAGLCLIIIGIGWKLRPFFIK